MLTKEEKEKILKQFNLHDKDTGSADVQIALLSVEIESLLKHLKKHPKDNASRRGLLKMVIKRKRLLNYLKRTNVRRYNALVKKLGLRSK